MIPARHTLEKLEALIANSKLPLVALDPRELAVVLQLARRTIQAEQRHAELSAAAASLLYYSKKLRATIKPIVTATAAARMSGAKVERALEAKLGPLRRLPGGKFAQTLPAEPEEL